jgi:hypothetical protein
MVLANQTFIFQKGNIQNAVQLVFNFPMTVLGFQNEFGIPCSGIRKFSKHLAMLGIYSFFITARIQSAHSDSLIFQMRLP